MSSQAAGAQPLRKERDKRTLQRATIVIGVVSLALAAALTYAVASASALAAGKDGSAPVGGSNAPIVASPTPTSDDEHDNPRSPATGVQSPRPGSAPVAVTGGS